MGKRRNWPSPDAIAEITAQIRAQEPEILQTHHLVGTERDCHVVIVQDGRLFDLLGDDTYLNTLIGVLKASGKPFYTSEQDIPGFVIGGEITEKETQ